VSQNGLQQIAGSAIVQEKCPLTQAPQRGGPELIRPRAALRNMIGQPRPHVMDGEVGEQVRLPLVQGRDR
jgi:hypothetical protein